MAGRLYDMQLRRGTRPSLHYCSQDLNIEAVDLYIAIAKGCNLDSVLLLIFSMENPML
jgi:hypothetical protein